MLERLRGEGVAGQQTVASLIERWRRRNAGIEDLQNSSTENRESVGDVADDVSVHRLHPLPVGRAGRENLQSTSSSGVKDGEGSNVGVGSSKERVSQTSPKINSGGTRKWLTQLQAKASRSHQGGP